MEQLRQLWKHRWIVLSGVALALCLDALWVLRQPKIYAATAVLQFEPNPTRPLGRQVEDLDTSGVGSYWNIREYYETQYRVVKSRSVAEGVVRRLGLQHDPDFLGVPAARRGSFRSVTVTQAATALVGRIRVEPVKESRLMNIVVEDQSPRRAQLLANTVVDVYVQRNLDHRLGSTRDAVRWLSNQLDDLRTNLSNAEERLQTFRREHSIVSENFTDQRNILGNRISQLSEALTQAQVRRFALTARTAEVVRAERDVLRSLQTVSSGMALDAPLSDRVRWRDQVGVAMSQLTAPEFLTSTVLTAMRTQFETALREESTSEIRYLQQSLELRGARARTNSVVSLFRAEVANIRGAAEAELRGVQRSEGNVRSELLIAQRQAIELNQQEMMYSRLTRERENHSKIFGIVLERTTEGNLMGSLQVNNMSVLEYALLPGIPIKPRVPLSLAVGGIAGVILGLLGATLAVLADRTVRSRADVEEGLNTPVLGFLPLVNGRGMRNQYKYRYGDAQPQEGPVDNLDLVVHSHPTSNVAELTRGIRTNLLFMSPDTPFQMLMVTSASPREGKTFTAVSLAISLAQSGKRVLLVDADLRRPRVHKVFRVHPPVGLTSILIGEATHDEAVIVTEVPNLSLLPCGPIPPNPAELLHSQKATEFMAFLRTQYDRIVFDSPPITAVTDALALGPQLDGVVLVVRVRQTRRDQAADVLRQLRALGSKVVGCVVNGIEPNDSHSYYYTGQYNYSSNPNEAAGGSSDARS
ncbi:MAG: polysaccharide biosynthesis tyrosine autokinase [Deltaproteobacteria bacterium]|nr:polysaccharide biosynthesis tyrosine autokinase [Deltaproteobacteria bacterium]